MQQRYANPSGTAPPPDSVTPTPALDNSRTISLLQQWAQEDSTEVQAAIVKAEHELAEFKAALNANRPPDKPAFP